MSTCRARRREELTVLLLGERFRLRRWSAIFFGFVGALVVTGERVEIERAVEGLKVTRLIDGYRGGPKGDKAALIDAIEAVARYALASRESLLELDVNPILVLPEGRGVIAVDAFIREGIPEGRVRTSGKRDCAPAA